jgi:hypothetical protein
MKNSVKRCERSYEIFYFSGTPVLAEVTLLQPWTLLDVGLNFDVASTQDNELVTINRIDTAMNSWLLSCFDPSKLSAPEDVSKVCRFEKGFQANDTVSISFLNTDQRNINVCVQYEINYDIG